MAETTQQNRFVDPGMFLAGFARRVFAVCPKCKGPALATAQSEYDSQFQPRNRRLVCLKCSFQLMPSEAKWLGPMTGIARERCKVCGYKWIEGELRRKTRIDALWKTIRLPCPSCGLVTRCDLEWMVRRFGKPIDPIFGLPLWLQTSCCGEILWVFNRNHLEALRSYIQATLRERTGVKAWSMLNRLPPWMTSAKNREAVLKGIDRLDSKLDLIDR